MKKIKLIYLILIVFTKYIFGGEVMKSYYLEDVIKENHKNPRHYLIPTKKEVENLKIGDTIRLIFVLKDKNIDNCRAERMWLIINEKNGKNYKGILTNQPVYIKELKIGSVIEFNEANIATIVMKSDINEKMKAIITRKAIEKGEINWIVRDEANNKEDTGLQFFYGDETEEYLNNPNNLKILSIEDILNIEPLIEDIVIDNGKYYEFDNRENKFIEVEE